MEVTSLPESEQEQQQPQQQQEAAANLQYQQQQQQQQQQYQGDYYHYYQSYDQSSSSYYSSYYQHYYPYHQNQWSQLYDQQQQSLQNYAYYQQQQQQQLPDYSASYQQQQPLYYQQNTAEVSASQIADSGGTTYNQQPQPQPPGLVNVAAAVPPASGVNPAAAAAIAALEQLTQFAGTMDAAERALGGLPAVNTPTGFGFVSMRPPPDGQLPHTGNSRRGGGPFRGGRSGNTGHHHGSAPPSRGRGRGKGKALSRRFKPGVASTSTYPETSAAYEHQAAVAVEVAQSASAPEKPVALKSQPAQIAWCELCRVDCTSLEILEQHRNGKRHKKNLLRIEELKKAVKPGDEIQNDQERKIDTKPEESQEPQVAQNGEEQKSAENLTFEAASDEPRVENKLQDNTEEKSKVPVEESSDQQGVKPKVNSSDNRRRGMKRKLKGGRGGKRMKTYEIRRRPVEPPKPKVVIPLICDLCNVKCDTREVLDRHLSGKKHIAKLKKFEGHQAIYGSTGLQALYPPNPVAQTHFVPQAPQPLYTAQGSFPPQFPPHAHQSTAAVAGLDPKFSQSSMPQKLEATSTVNPATAVLRL